MAISISSHYDDDSKVVTVIAVGKMNKKNILSTIQASQELCTKHGCRKILFDITKCPVDHSLMQGFELMKDMPASTGISINNKLAILSDPKLYPVERARFIENVVDNRPNPAFKIFTLEEEAREWLKKR